MHASTCSGVNLNSATDIPEPSRALVSRVTDIKNPTPAKKPDGGAPDSLGLGQQSSRLSVTQYTSACNLRFSALRAVTARSPVNQK
jgi:hypothetical protein